VYAFCEFAMVEYRWFAVGILMMYVIVSEILALPVIWPPSWIYDTHRFPMTSAVRLLKSVRVAVGIFSLCALELEICLGVFLPPPIAGKRRKKTVAGTRVNEMCYINLRFTYLLTYLLSD